MIFLLGNSATTKLGFWGNIKLIYTYVRHSMMPHLESMCRKC